LVVVALVVAIGVVMASRNAPPPADGSADAPPAVETGAPVPADTAAAPSEQLPRFVEVGADKCVPCKMMQPVLDDLRADYADELRIEFADVWKNPDLGERYGVRSIPAQIIYDREGDEVFRHQGFWAKEDIDAKLRELDIVD